MCIPLKSLFSRHKGIGVQFTDEPTGNLDPNASEEVMNLFHRINQRGVTVLVATHDVAQIKRLNHPSIALSEGRIVT